MYFAYWCDFTVDIHSSCRLSLRSQANRDGAALLSTLRQTTGGKIAHRLAKSIRRTDISIPVKPDASAQIVQNSVYNWVVSNRPDKRSKGSDFTRIRGRSRCLVCEGAAGAASVAARDAAHACRSVCASRPLCAVRLRGLGKEATVDVVPLARRRRARVRNPAVPCADRPISPGVGLDTIICLRHVLTDGEFPRP